MSFLKKIYLLAFVAFGVVSCTDFQPLVDRGRVVAEVGNRSLRSMEVKSAIPDGLTGDDSLAFVELYADRWIRRQVKVLEAERIFTASSYDIELMVEAYREALLTRKLDRYYINTADVAPITQRDIQSYYSQHYKDFPLDKIIVRGRILRLPSSYSESSKLLSLMRSSSKDSALDLQSIIRKNADFVMEEFDGWVEYYEFLSRLPLSSSSRNETYLRRSGVQSMTSNGVTYYFEITAYRYIGSPSPLDMVEGQIRNILITQYNGELIRQHEEALFDAAVDNIKIRNIAEESRKEAARKRRREEIEASKLETLVGSPLN
ncbi:MAG: hypothetical protein SNH79_00525 [Rikenellaceae bacterium]